MMIDQKLYLLPPSGEWYVFMAVAFIAAAYVLAVTLPRLKRILAAQSGGESDRDSRQMPPVSVVVCPNNDTRHLRQLLTDILSQDYDAPFEIVVVNDEGQSRADDIVREMQLVHRNLFITFLPDDTRSLSRRKLAVTLGVKAAHHDCLLLTTSNCTVPSPHWLRLMARHFADPSTEVVIGYVRSCGDDDTPDSGRGSRLRTFDRVRSALVWLASAVAGRPLRGTACNLAYHRQLFFDHKGFSSALHLNYGDDDLFVSEIANPDNCVAEISPDAVVDRHESDLAYSHRSERLRREFTSSRLRRAPFRLLGSVSVALWLWIVASVGAAVCGLPSLIPLAAVILTGAGLWAPLALVWRRTSMALEGCRQGGSVLLCWLVEPLRTLGLRMAAWRRRRSNFTWG